MRNLFIRIWNDSVGSKVIATGIIIGISSFLAWITGSWGYIQSALLNFLELLKYNVYAPLWLIMLITPTLLFLIPLIQKLRPSDPSFFKYTNDELLGVLWSWKWCRDYPSYNYKIFDIVARCPNCKARLKFYKTPTISFFSCINSSCDWVWDPREFHNNTRNISEDQVIEKLEHEVDRKVYNKEY